MHIVNYNILYYSLEPKVNYQPNTAFRASVSFKYTDKNNDSIRATLQDYGAEIKWNVLNKGSLNMKFDYIKIRDSHRT